MDTLNFRRTMKEIDSLAWDYHFIRQVPFYIKEPRPHLYDHELPMDGTLTFFKKYNFNLSISSIMAFSSTKQLPQSSTNQLLGFKGS